MKRRPSLGFWWLSLLGAVVAGAGAATGVESLFWLGMVLLIPMFVVYGLLGAFLVLVLVGSVIAVVVAIPCALLCEGRSSSARRALEESVCEGGGCRNSLAAPVPAVVSASQTNSTPAFAKSAEPLFTTNAHGRKEQDAPRVG